MSVSPIALNVSSSSSYPLAVSGAADSYTLAVSGAADNPLAASAVTASSSGSSEDLEGPVAMSLAVRVLWDGLFTAIIVVAIGGNLIVLWIISGELSTIMTRGLT